MHCLYEPQLVNTDATNTRHTCKFVRHMRDCAIVEHPNGAVLNKALDNTALDNNTGVIETGLQHRISSNTSTMYKAVCEPIAPYVQPCTEIDCTRVRPTCDNRTGLVNNVIENKNTRVTCANGGGGKYVLTSAAAVKLKKREIMFVCLRPMHKHNDTVIEQGRLFNAEFKHTHSVYVYAYIVDDTMSN